VWSEEATPLPGKETRMASKSKEARQDQKVYWEKRLDERLTALKEKGADKIAKDTTLRKIRAKIREADSRLKAISQKEKKVEEMAQRKVEKAKAAKKERSKKQKEPAPTEEVSKRQKKKQKKRQEKQAQQGGKQEAG
jgi:hypothetical protein